MGLLDSVIGALGQGQGGGAGGGQAQLINLVLGMLTQQGGGQGGAGAGLGGLGGLLEKFQQNGLGDVAASWVSTGQNQPVSPEQLNNVLGSDMIGGLAQQLGLSHGDAAGQLSQILPQLVDKLTPNGQVPQGGVSVAGLDMGDLLGAFLKR